MTEMVAGLPGGSGPFAVRDLERMPDDGRRYELLDGVLIVSPIPGTRHQKMVVGLAAVLNRSCPDDLHALIGPFAVRPGPDTELQPDALVARAEDLTEELLPVAPLLTVEVLSPSTALIDINTKKAAYQRMGVPSYWIIDPVDARLTVFELDDAGVYAQVAEVKGEDGVEVERPFPVRVVPAELLGTLWRRV
ncbi:Uma2 family endonuclease [Actinocrispum wychmicini]|uniref:Uma2 family endonuclease n=1 Tax=Actinocrispum wychmicini TaxID=1213861 RepID=A0A4R2J1Y2_9PSEU|nr:Uma2 family endonuclease [Actinocrispum wychmicini]TCO50808.1 Uma2 family endonuclease [Actinocrispum wychmicini]